MPDRVDLPRIADVRGRIALQHDQIRELAEDQHAAIVELEQRRRMPASDYTESIIWD
jgi:hypothetical protein